MKIILTQKAIDLHPNFLDDSEYHDFSEDEQLIMDAHLYADEAYIDNEFTNFEEWCKQTGQSELQECDYRLEVKKKIGKMLIEDLITFQ